MDTMETIRGLEILTQRAASISKNTQNRKTTRWEVTIVSLVFARLTLNAFSILRLSPGSAFSQAMNGMQIWDLSSIGSLSRNVMEAYLTLRYMIQPMASTSEEALRRKIWDYHESSERYKMMKDALPNSARLAELRAEKDEFRAAIQDDMFFRRLDDKIQRRILNGEKFRLRTAAELCGIAGVGQGYYDSMFRFGSNHTHSSPYSISLMNIDGPMTPEAQTLLRISLQTSTGFMALAIRDFISTFPDQSKEIGVGERNLLHLWEGILKWELDSPSHNERV
jgi:hypothetical protein